MASPAEVAKNLPETLPDDFSGWDGDDRPVPASPASDFAAADALAQPAAQAQEPAVVAEEDESANADSLPPAIYQEQEAFRERLKALGLALKSEPAAPPQWQTPTCLPKEVLHPQVRPSAAVPDVPQDAPPLLQPKVLADEEAFFNQLRAMGSVLNSQPIKPSHKPAPFRALMPARKSAANASLHVTPSEAILADAPLRITPPVQESAPPPAPAPVRALAPAPIRNITPEPEFIPAPPPAPARAPEPVRAAVPAPVPAPQPAAISAPEEVVPKPAPLSAPFVSRWPEPFRVAAKINAATLSGVPMFRSDLADVENESPDTKKKWIKIGAIGAVTILLLILLIVRLLSPGRPTLAKQSVEPQPTAADAATVTMFRKPSPSTQFGSRQSSAGSGQSNGNSVLPVDSQLMSDQLNAAPRIPQDVKVKVKEDAPPPPASFNAASNGELDDADAIGALSGQAPPLVKLVPYPVVTISTADAEALLVQRTKPVYPQQAWYSGVTGKVVFEATVSRTGTVEYVRILNGPVVFRQAALDAVKTWRYRPYVVDGVPREFRTTVDVIFDQAGSKNPLSLLHLGSHVKKDSASVKSAGPGAGAP